MPRDAVLIKIADRMNIPGGAAALKHYPAYWIQRYAAMIQAEGETQGQ